ncbi:MAG: flagellar basal body L-ring protein FlgH [Beijerinckiaceae bacterium]
MKTSALIALAAATCSLSACSSLDRLSSIGEQPKLSAIENPTAQAGYKPVQMPMPAAQPVSYHGNSLWRTGSRAFFKDQRARQVGDIMTVKVKITDRANIDNTTTRSRKAGESGAAGGQIGGSVTGAIGSILGRVLPENKQQLGSDGDALLTVTSDSTSTGAGSVRRQEQLATNVAAVITQVLPNGNLVLEGKQEVRVNFEVRELIVAGIVRPEDIENDNTIDSSKIAQARIAYGGRGQITDVQQPRYGQQVMDVLLPF